MSEILGADEVGNGSLAGSVVVGGVRAPQDWHFPGLRDSKRLSARQRQSIQASLLSLVQNGTITLHLAERTAVQIDQWGVAKALQDAYIEVFRALHAPDCQIIVDGDLHFDGLGLDDLNIQAIIKADSKFPTVMAASILAKTYRDGKMIQLAQQYPAYDWEHNMGYGSPKHLSAITQHGISPLHRLSYAPMKNMKQPK